MAIGDSYNADHHLGFVQHHSLYHHHHHSLRKDVALVITSKRRYAREDQPTLWMVSDGDEVACQPTRKLGTAALLDDHTRQVAVHDIHVIVVVEHRDGGNTSRRAARTAAGCRHGRRIASTSPLLLLLLLLLDDVGVGVLLVVEERTVAGAVEGRVAAWNDDEVPAERLEVDDEWITTASFLRTVLVAVQVQVAL